MKWLLIHGYQWDPALQSMPQQWVAEDLDRIAVALNFGPFNYLRSKIAHISQNNDSLIAGAEKLGYSTICGHSHIPVQMDGFINDGSWRGPYQPHYVLFPKDKVAVISDLHVGDPNATPYEKTLLAFLAFAKDQGWTLYCMGDTLDLWAHQAGYITQVCHDVVEALASYPVKLIGGNHDNDLNTLGQTLGFTGNIPWYTFIDTDDKPSLIGWPA